MADTVTQSQTVAAKIESGRILDVDITTYTVSVTTEFTKKPVTGVKFATPYQHYVNGEGIYFMPEVGSLCWICFPSDHNRPFVIAWGPADTDGNARSKKKDLNPGDIYLGTRDENFLILRRGGVVQIGGGPLSQRIFLPIGNTIKDFCENYGLHTIGGDFVWSVEREETTTDGKRPTNLTISAREKANDEKHIAVLKIGSHDSDDKLTLSLIIKASGADGADTVIDLQMTKEGNITWKVKKDVKWVVEGDYSFETKKNFKVKATDDIDLQSKNVKIKGDSGVTIESGGSFEIKGAPKVIIKSKVDLGSGAIPVALATPLITWLSSHIHPTTAPGAPTGPPAVPPPGAIAASDVKAS